MRRVLQILALDALLNSKGGRAEMKLSTLQSQRMFHESDDSAYDSDEMSVFEALEASPFLIYADNRLNRRNECFCKV